MDAYDRFLMDCIHEDKYDEADVVPDNHASCDEHGLVNREVMSELSPHDLAVLATSMLETAYHMTHAAAHRNGADTPDWVWTMIDAMKAIEEGLHDD